MNKRILNHLILVIAITGVLLQISCRPSGEVDTNEIDLTLELERFDLAMWEASKEMRADPTRGFEPVYKRHLEPHRDLIARMVFGVPDTLDPLQVLPDSLIYSQFAPYLSDSVVGDLLDTIAEAFPANYDFEGPLLDPFKRYKYYFPSAPIPPIRTFITDYPPGQIMPEAVDNLYFSDNYLGIGLHYYMGEDFKYYRGGLPQFIRRRFEPEFIPIGIFNGYAQYHLARRNPIDPATGQPVRRQYRLVDMVVAEGVKLHFLDKMLPETPDSMKIMFSASQWDDAEVMEGKIYKDMMPHLFQSDPKMLRMYIEENPFTNIYGKESPPRLGHYTGWKIVKSYVERHPEVTLPQLMYEIPFEEIFQESKYRPAFEN